MPWLSTLSCSGMAPRIELTVGSECCKVQTILITVLVPGLGQPTGSHFNDCSERDESCARAAVFLIPATHGECEDSAMARRAMQMVGTESCGDRHG